MQVVTNPKLNDESTNETIRVLTDYCSRPVNSVADACLILVLVRKIIENYKPNKRYPMVKFHCDWALHTIKHAEEVVNSFLVYIDNAVIEFHKNFSSQAGQDLGQKIKELAQMKNFGLELLVFLDDHKLPKTFIGDNKAWFDFLRQYLLLVLEAPLQTPDTLTYVKNFSFQRYGEKERKHVEGFGEAVINSTGIPNAPINYFVEFRNGDLYSAEIKIPEM